MLRKLTFLLLLFTSLALQALPVKDIYKSVVSIRTFAADSSEVQTCCGVFLTEDGEVLAPYSALLGCVRADVQDFRGNVYRLHRILSANRNQDLVRFSVEGLKKSVTAAPIVSTGLEANAKLLAQPYQTVAKSTARETAVAKVEKFEDFSYYTLTLPNEAADVSLPLFSVVGKEAFLAGLVQHNPLKDATTACAIDARFALALRPTGTGLLNSDLRALNLPYALPADVEEAFTFLNLPFPSTALKRIAVDDFITAFPSHTEGYLSRATLLATQKEYAAADADMAKALEVSAAGTDSTASRPDAVRYNISRMVLGACQTDSLGAAEAGWTLARAEAEADAAQELSPNPLYLMQKARVLITAERYAEAADVLMEAASDSAFATPDIFFSIAQCMSRAGAAPVDVLEKMDRAIALIPSPCPTAQAQLYLRRAYLRQEMRLYREAVEDYNKYEQVIGPKNLDDQFYYLRYGANVQARRYQQALDDIRSARIAAPSNPDYELEEASLLAQVGEYADALPLLESLHTRYPQSGEVARLLGLVKGETGAKAEAVKLLRSARELGAEVDDALLKRYQ